MTQNKIKTSSIKAHNKQGTISKDKKSIVLHVNKTEFGELHLADSDAVVICWYNDE